MMDQIIQHLNKSRHVLLTSHVNPDGDAIGSLIAMGLALDTLRKRVVLYNESPIPAVYRFLPGVERIQHHLDVSAQYDTAIVLDCGNLDRVGHSADIIQRIPVIINVDHHYTNTGFGHLHQISPSACATAEIVYQIIKALGISFNTAIGTSIYTGILTDTGSFRFSNTNRSAFVICDEMVGLGVKPDLIAQHVYGTYSLGRIKLLNHALDSIEISPNGKLAMMVVTRNMMRKTETDPCDADGLINYARSIESVKLAVMIQEPPERHGVHSATGFNVSLRSNGSVDAAAIASLFGGGGHFTAAGFHIDAPLFEVKKRLYEIAMQLSQWEPKACLIPNRPPTVAVNAGR
jgi:phosphoesterase RecJ-like protein